MFANTINRAKRMIFPITAGVPPIKFETMFPEVNSVTLDLKNWHVDLRAGNLWELVCTSFICRSHKPKICVEIGTGRGRSTLQMASNIPEDSVIHTFDISKIDEIGLAFKGDSEAQKRINFHNINVHDYDFSELKGKVDFILVDASHEYEDVVKDSELAFELVSENGIIIWDDFGVEWPGVIKACQELSKKHKLHRILGTSYVIYKN